MGRVAAAVTWEQVLAWRLRRQLLEPRAGKSAVAVAGALGGVQAQVGSAAELAVAVRRATPRKGEVADALSKRRLVKTWAMRGTLHVLDPAQAPAFLALMAAARSWERAAWVKATGVAPAEMAALGEAVAQLLDGEVLTREELVARLVARKRFARLGDPLRSGWGSLLKPFAWQGLLCFGPGQGNRVTFTNPTSWLRQWPAPPSVEEAAATAVPIYLRAYGPATPEGFDRWLTRGSTRKPMMREWFDALGDQLATVEVEGQSAQVLAEDLDELTGTKPTRAVRLLPGFDQYVLGPGTQDEQLIAPARRAEVSKAAGWIAPTVIVRGRVAGTWVVDGDALAVTWFAECGRVPRTALAKEAARVAAILGRDLALQVD